MSTAFDFESFIEKAKDPLLQVLFSGGVIRNKKLQRGTILQLNSASSKEFNAGEQLFSISELTTTYMFRIREEVHINQTNSLFVQIPLPYVRLRRGQEMRI